MVLEVYDVTKIIRDVRLLNPLEKDEGGLPT